MHWVTDLSCHSCRDVVGGRVRHFFQHPLRYRMWIDLYTMLVARGTSTDLRFIG